MKPKTFVVLAAGAGTRIGRVGESLHKALVPLAGKAVLSHILDLAPPHADIVLCVGHRHEQIMEYMRLAHPTITPRYVIVDNTAPGSGPGETLYAARDLITPGSDMIFTSCDTLWTKDMTIWNGGGESWSGVAHIPPGTDEARWCRMQVDPETNYVDIKDKEPGGDGEWFAYIGLSYIVSEDLTAFWDGIEHSGLVDNEKQVTGGLENVLLTTRRLAWVDVGDEAAYKDAVARYSGYDFTKMDEATYVLPEEGRVVKFWKNQEIMQQRLQRGKQLYPAVPEIVGSGLSMMAYAYIPGTPVYTTADLFDAFDNVSADNAHTMKIILNWAHNTIWEPVSPTTDTYDTCMRFYKDKTLARVSLLDEPLRRRATDALELVDWDWLADGCVPAVIHGDFNFGNIVTDGSRFYGIDWRENFGGETTWGDMRYDLAKLMGGAVVHWDRAQRGDFRPWDADKTEANLEAVRDYIADSIGNKDTGKSVEVIAALAFLNSAPLHEKPLDEILVSRGTAWLMEIL